MATSTTTQIELQPPNPKSEITNRPTAAAAATTTNDSTNIIQESLVADSEVPEGGYGWWVVFACACLNFWGIGIVYGWGIFQAALVKEGVASPSTLAFVGSLMVTGTPLWSVFIARAIRKLGARLSAFVAIFFLTIGAVLSSFATHNVGALFITTGLLIGIGMTFCFMIASMIPPQYFNTKRGLAYGIVHGGTGLGGASLSFMVNALIQKLGLAWTYRVIGLLTLVTTIPAALIVKERFPIRPTPFIEWSLFKDLRFALLFVAGAIGTFSLFVPSFFLPLFTTAIGLSPGAGAGVVAACNFSSAIGRILFGHSCDAIGAINSLFLTVFLSAISLLVIWPVSTSLAPTLIFAIVNGLSNGGWFSTMPMVVGSLFGSLRVGTAMGMIVTGWAVGYIMGAPIAGFILEAAGGENTLSAFRPAIIWAGSMALGSSALIGVVRLRTSKRILAKV